MARWHFSIFLVPEIWARENGDNLDQYLISGWNLTAAWVGFDMPDSFYPEFIPASHDWSVDLLHWTSTKDDNNIYIGLNEEDIDYFQVQIDMRNDASGILDLLSTYAKSQNLSILLMEEKRIIEADLHVLKQAAQQSRSYKKYHDKRP